MAKFPHFSNGNFELLPQSASARLPINFPVDDMSKLYALVAPAIQLRSTAFFSGAAMVCQLQCHSKMKMKRESEDSQKKRPTLRRLPQCDDESEKKLLAKRR